MITFEPCNIFELIWYSEWPLGKKWIIPTFWPGDSFGLSKLGELHADFTKNYIKSKHLLYDFILVSSSELWTDSADIGVSNNRSPYQQQQQLLLRSFCCHHLNLAASADRGESVSKRSEGVSNAVFFCVYIVPWSVRNLIVAINEFLSCNIRNAVCLHFATGPLSSSSNSSCEAFAFKKH